MNDAVANLMNTNAAVRGAGDVILACSGVVKRYGGDIKVIDGLDLTLERGKIAGLLGPNGNGKTTLIKLIAGLLTSESGSITINGKAPGKEAKAQISYLPERMFLDRNLKVREMVGFYSRFFADFSSDRAYDMLSRLAIDTGARIATLSKGTCEKVQLILVMSRNASLYLLDEPMGGVDPAARDYIIDTIINNYSDDAAVLISTHIIADVERILDHAFFISAGKISLSMSVDEIRQKYAKSVDELFREEFRC